MVQLIVVDKVLDESLREALFGSTADPARDAETAAGSA
jgi:hypothetical protein